MRLNDPIILMTTDINMPLSEVVSFYIKRWNLEVTFRECRDYLGVETQRQWSDLAIARTTPLLFALYTLNVQSPGKVSSLCVFELFCPFKD